MSIYKYVINVDSSELVIDFGAPTLGHNVRMSVCSVYVHFDFKWES